MGELLASENSGPVLIAGVGGLGIPAGLALVRAGVRNLRLIDPDAVDLSNLPRQIIYSTDDIGMPKVEAARQHLLEMDSEIYVRAEHCKLDSSNAARIISGAAFVIDGTDDPATKFLINDLCVGLRVPFVYAGVLGLTGQAMTVIPGETACLRCLFEEPPDAEDTATCRDAGILGPVAGAIGEVEASEAIRWLSGERPALAGAILSYEAKTPPRTRVIPVSARAGCSCGAAEAAVTIKHNRVGER